MALGVTSFNVEPVMSVLIIMGNHNKAEVDIGIDIFAEQIKGQNNTDYFEKQIGKGKLFPREPTCNLFCKEGPCMVPWSNNYSITSDVPTDILCTLDIYYLFLRQPGLTHFSLVDAHGSRI